MPRPKKLNPQLEENGVLLNEFGIEIARLTLNNLLIINEQEVYFEITRWAATHGGECSLGHLYKFFGRYNSWGYDPEVHAVIEDLLELQVIEYVEGIKTAVRPKVTPRVAVKVIPPYTTRAEAHAGLETLNDE